MKSFRLKALFVCVEARIDQLSDSINHRRIAEADTVFPYFGREAIREPNAADQFCLFVFFFNFGLLIGPLMGRRKPIRGPDFFFLWRGSSLPKTVHRPRLSLKGRLSFVFFFDESFLIVGDDNRRSCPQRVPRLVFKRSAKKKTNKKHLPISGP